MTDRSEFDELHLPPDLAELDAELSSIAYEERSSFGPELEAELEREWGRLRARPRLPARQLMAAGVAGLLMVGLGVPSARASLVRLLGSLPSPDPSAAVTSSVTPPPAAGGPLFYEVPAGGPGDEEPYAGLPSIPATPPPTPEPEPFSGYVGPEATFPLLRDRDRLQAIIAENYPQELQEAGVGGTVRLLLWVDSVGAVDFVNLGQSSGEPLLDRAALEVAPTFGFEPARRWGEPVGTWVEFDMVFEPLPQELDREVPLPEVVPVDEPDEPTMETPVVSAWRGGMVLPSPVRREAGELLRAALADDELVARLGPLDAILEGSPPPGRAPTAWRGAVSAALEAAIVNDPDNPAPLLALSRIRRKQGLRDEARALVERGLQRVSRLGEAVSPSLRAELHHERGTLLKERWMAVRDLGWVSAEGLASSECPAARSAAGADDASRASAARLIAWNFLCPARLGSVMDRHFKTDAAAEQEALGAMLASFGAAVAAWPAHAGANVELLLALAEEGSWEALAHAARRFVWVSRGHPRGLLLAGLALQRLGRPAEARAQLDEALQALPAAQSARLQDVGALLTPDQAERYPAAPGAERDAWLDDFWRPLDPIRSTEVNERRVEHLVRAAYAEMRLGGTGTDAGRVWIRYGEPNEVRMVQEGADLSIEFWDYGHGPDLTFRRFPSAGSTGLTAEGRAYVDELLDVYPHRYGPLGRDVFALSGEVNRFRGTEEGVTDLELRVPFPSVLRSPAPERVEVTVFVLDAAGRALSRTRRVLSTRMDPVLFRVPAPPAASSVVVEFYDPASGRVAALRETVGEVWSEEGPDISDLLMTRRAVPDRGSVRREASWIRPLPLTGAVEDPVVGAFFELYGIGKATSWYRVRAEAESLETGERFSVPVRPAGEDGYRTTWDRLSEEPEVTGEFVGLALSNLPRGRYTLRVVVDFPLAGGPLVAERTLTLG